MAPVSVAGNHHLGTKSSHIRMLPKFNETRIALPSGQLICFNFTSLNLNPCVLIGPWRANYVGQTASFHLWPHLVILRLHHAPRTFPHTVTTRLQTMCSLSKSKVVTDKLKTTVVVEDLNCAVFGIIKYFGRQSMTGSIGPWQGPWL
jgi:hypothetical protein